MIELKLSFLGSFEAVRNDTSTIHFRSLKERALLAYLAEETDRAHQRSSLLGLLWPELPESSARNNLSQTLSRLRRLIENTAPHPEYFIANRQTIHFSIHNHIQIDTVQCRTFLDDSYRGKMGDVSEESRLESGLLFYRGEFLQGFSLPDCEEFEMWLLFKREYYRELILGSLKRLATLYLDSGRYADAQTVAQRHLTLEPWAEVAYQQLIMASALNGQRTEALTRYEQLREILWTELGVAPDEATTALMQRIKRGELAPANLQPAILQAPSEPVDTLFADSSSLPTINTEPKVNKDSQKTEEAYLSSEPHPLPTAVVDSPGIKQRAIFHRPPRRANSLFGRERELAEITNFLSNPQCRLLTLTGPGGVGKTRLAIEVANLINTQHDGKGDDDKGEKEAVNLFAHGVAFVSVAALDEPAAMVNAIQAMLGISTPANQEAQESLLNYLEGLELLLLLDNYEHLANDPALLIAILEQAPAVKLLLTSRIRLNLVEEWVYEISGLSLPDLDNQAHEPTPAEIAHSSAVQLFVSYATRVRSDFVLSAENALDVLRICTLVTGLPLAIELAASWIRVMPSAEIHAELQHNINFLVASAAKPERHRTFEAVFDSSWRYLAEQERMAILQLSIFRGSFDRDAAFNVADASLFLLASLIDHSFLKRGDRERYEMHELLRQIATERLAADPQLEEKTRTAHANYYGEFLAKRTAWMSGAQVTMALDSIEQSFENIRIAWRRLLETASWQRLDLALDALYYFCTIRGRRSEAVHLLEVLEQTLMRTYDNRTERLLTRVQSRLGACYLGLGNQNLAQMLIQEALDRAKADDDRQELAFCLSQLGFVLSTSGDLANADLVYTESLQLYQQINHRVGTADLLNKRGVIAHDLGMLTVAKEFYVRSYTIAKVQQNIYLLSIVLFNLGKISEGMGDYSEAVRYYRESMPHQQALNDSEGMGYVLHGLARVEMHLGNYPHADELCVEALNHFRDINFRRGIIFALSLLGEIALQQGHAQTASTHLQESLTLAQRFNSPLFISVNLTLLGRVALALDDLELAWTYGCEAIELAQQTKSIAAEATTLCLLGAITTLRNEYQAAKEYFEKALALAQESVAPLIQLEAQLGVATLFFHRGEKYAGAELLQQIQTNPALTYFIRQSIGQLEAHLI